MTEIENWGGWDRNIYSNPEKCGMRLVGSLEDGNASYTFDTVIVVQDEETGKLYAAHDSGCSCPTPFEDVHGLADLTEIRSVADIQQFVKVNDDSYKDWSLDDRLALYQSVQDVLRAAS